MRMIHSIILFAVIFSVVGKANNTPTPIFIPPTLTPAPIERPKLFEWCKIIRNGWVGFKDIKDLDRLNDILLSGDGTAATNFMNISIVNGSAVKFNKGQEVYLVERKIIKEYVKIRRRGQTTEYWAFRKIIEE